MHSKLNILKMKVCLTEGSDMEGNSDSEQVGNTDWRGCEVCVSLPETELSVAMIGIFWRKN